MSNIVQQWFGESFYQLAPSLQALHSSGGILSGTVTLTHGHGIAALIGRRISAKMGLPQQSGEYPFKVMIGQKDGKLLWGREFGATHQMLSIFEPHGTYPNGFWRETTGAVTLDLGVHIEHGGWYWQQRRMAVAGISLPKWLFPKSKAYKYIENDRYVFAVSISLPLLGEVVKYSGKLRLEPADLS